MSKLREALSGKEWIHAADVASVVRGSIDMAVLHEVNESGIPLLARWYMRHRHHPETMFRQQGQSRAFFHSIFWRLVDSGFDLATRWPIPDPKALSEYGLENLFDSDGPPTMDLLDVMLDEGSPELLGQMESRWGEPWDPSFLATRVRSWEKKGPGVASVLPRFHHDVARDNRDMAKWWISKGVDVNLRNEWGQTPLFYATSPTMAQLLLEKGADPSVRDRHSRTAFEHWIDQPSPIEKGKFANLVLKVFPKVRDAMPMDVLARAVDEHISTGEYLHSPTKKALVELQPHLSREFLFGQDPLNKLGPPQSLGATSASTLLGRATKRAWQTSLHKSQEILAWLAIHTPKEGNEVDHELARLAMLAFQPAEALKSKSSATKLAVSFPRALELIRQHAASPDSSLASKMSMEKVGEMLLGVSAAAIHSDHDRIPGGRSFGYTPLLQPSPTTWMDPSPEGTLLSQVLTCAADVMGENIRPSSASLCKAMVAHVRLGRPIPADTLLPALRLFSRLAPGKVSGSTLASGSPPGSADLEAETLSLGLAWWLAAGTPTHQDVFEAAGASPALASQVLGVTEKSGEPWPAWRAMWAARQLDRTLVEIPGESSGPSARLPRARL